jgi:hypothetical protein
MPLRKDPIAVDSGRFRSRSGGSGLSASASLVAALSKAVDVNAGPLPRVQPTRYFVIRERRDGPLVPARLQWLDHEPGEPSNKLDRGYSSVFPQVDIAGVYVEPERLIERLFESTPDRLALAPTHWKYAAPVSEADYRLRIERMRWAERHRPDDPTLRPRRRVESDQIAMPDFTRENSI